MSTVTLFLPVYKSTSTLTSKPAALQRAFAL